MLLHAVQMEKGSRSSINNLCTKDTFKMESAMGMVEALQRLVRYTRVGSMKIIWMVLVSSIGLMAVSMKENSLVARSRVKVSTSGPMVRCMTANSRMMSALASAICTTQMEKLMKVTGVKVKRMEKELTYSQTVQAIR